MNSILKAIQCLADRWSIRKVEDVIRSPRLVGEDHFLENFPSCIFEGRACGDKVYKGLEFVFVAESAEGVDLRVYFVLKVCQGIVSGNDTDKPAELMSAMDEGKFRPGGIRATKEEF